MTDPRFDQLASIISRHSCDLQKGEHVLIEAFDIPDEMVVSLVEAARAMGAHPHVAERSPRVMRALNEAASEDQLRMWADCDLFRMERMQAYVGLRGGANANEMAGVPDEQTKRIGALYGKPVHMERRVKHTKWVVLRWPSPGMAQLARMSTRDFESAFQTLVDLYTGQTTEPKGLPDDLPFSGLLKMGGL